MTKKLNAMISVHDSQHDFPFFFLSKNHKSIIRILINSRLREIDSIYGICVYGPRQSCENEERRI